MTAVDLAGYGLIGTGICFLLIAAIGLIRLPDVYSRLSAVTKAATLGVVLILAGSAALSRSGWAIAVLLGAVALQLATAPVAGHALGRAAYGSRAPLAVQTRFDELAEERFKRQ